MDGAPPAQHHRRPPVQALTGETWVAIGTGILALATFALAVMAYWNVRKTGDLVIATEKSAAAAAATVLEIQRDRELAHAPYIDWSAQTIP